MLRPLRNADLRQAFEKDNLEGAKQALAAGANPNGRGTNRMGVPFLGESAVHVAARKREAAIEMLNSHAQSQGKTLDVNARRTVVGGTLYKNDTALHGALMQFNGPVLREMLTVPGADVHKKFRDLALPGMPKLSLIQSAERRAATPDMVPPAARDDFVEGLLALVEHGRVNGYTVNCGAFSDKVAALEAARKTEGKQGEAHHVPSMSETPMQVEERSRLLGQALGLGERPVPETTGQVSADMAAAEGKSRSSLPKKLVPGRQSADSGRMAGASRPRLTVRTQFPADESTVEERVRTMPDAPTDEPGRTRDGEQEQSGWEAA